MKNTSKQYAALVLALAAGLAPSFAAQAQSNPWLVRLRAVDLKSDNGGSTTPNLDLKIDPLLVGVGLGWRF